MSLPKSSVLVPPASAAAAPRLSHRVAPSAVAALLGMSLERLIRGRRLLILSALFLIPSGIALLGRHYDRSYDPAVATETLIFFMIPQALVPLTALMFASGMVSDEVEEQTLTYLMIRPIPRSVIYLVKLAATILVAGAMTFGFTMVTIGVIEWGMPGFGSTEMLLRSVKSAGLPALSTIAYASLFGLLGVLTRISLLLGIVYILVFEGLFANINFVVRRGTVMYYVRVLAERWLGLHVESWSIDFEVAPSGSEAFLTLIVASVIAASLAAWLFSVREFRVKTPEGT